MPRDSKSETDTPEGYRRYRVPDPEEMESSVDNSNIDDAQEDAAAFDTCGLLFTIGISLFSILFYLAAFGLIAWVIASMLGLID